MMKAARLFALSALVSFLFTGISSAAAVSERTVIRAEPQRITVVRYHKGLAHEGVIVRRLPRGYERITIGKTGYFFHGGVFYVGARGGFRVVSGPVGAFVRVLPQGYTVVRVGNVSYHYFHGTFYLWNAERRGYVVVKTPEGVVFS